MLILYVIVCKLYVGLICMPITNKTNQWGFEAVERGWDKILQKYKQKEVPKNQKNVPVKMSCKLNNHGNELFE